MLSPAHIPARYFHDEAVFARERERIFRTTWQFFCFRSELREDNDFVAQDVAGIPVVVQNMKGELHAFHNVCSHRNVPLQSAASGNRHLFCPYHGWVYGRSGEPIGIPHNAEFYPIEPAERPQLALRQFSLAVCGNLVFVAIAPTRPFAEQMGQWLPLVEKMAHAMDDVHFSNDIHTTSNWKWIVHNAFDDIHAQFVHPRSSLDTTGYIGDRWDFHPFGTAAEDFPASYARRHAQFTVSMDQPSIQGAEALWTPFFPTRAFAFDEYVHLYLYPNLLITSVQGFWYNVVRYTPVDAGHSITNYHLLPTRQADGSSSTVQPELLYRLAFSSLRIFQEDLGAVEVGQSVIHSVTRQAVFGRREDKILSFEKAYMHAMGESGTPVSSIPAGQATP